MKKKCSICKVKLPDITRADSWHIHCVDPMIEWPRKPVNSVGQVVSIRDLYQND